MLSIFSFLIIFCLAQRADSAELPCLDCHKSKTTGTTLHMAVEMGCGSCHNAPHKEEKPALSLAAQVPDLCFMCHDSAPFSKTHIHSAVAGGMCTSCHNPHSSINKNLLTANNEKLCFQCHEGSSFNKGSKHYPVAQGECTSCHNPHSSDNPSNLEAPKGELCMNCHEADKGHVLANTSPGQQHPLDGLPDPSLKSGTLSCLSCHSPHSSGQMRLLRYEGGRIEGLCLRCHKRSYIRIE